MTTTSKPAKKSKKRPKAADQATVVLTPAQETYLETITLEGMARMRWSRLYAERKARKFLSKANTPAKLKVIATRLGKLDLIPPKPELKPFEKKVPGAKKMAKNIPKPKPPLTRAQIAKLPPADPPLPKPKTALQRLERALGPDDGKRRRGGSPVVQGGSPGLGRRS